MRRKTVPAALATIGWLWGLSPSAARATAPAGEPVGLVFYLDAMKREGGEFQRRLPDFSGAPEPR